MNAKMFSLALLKEINGFSQLGLITDEEREQVVVLLKQFMISGDREILTKLSKIEFKNDELKKKIKEELKNGV